MAVTTETMQNEKRTVLELFLESATAFSEKPAMLVKDGEGYQTYTYRRLRSDLEALSATFLSKGLSGKGLLIFGENGYAFALGFLAALSIGAIAIPVNKSVSTDLPVLCDLTHPAAVFYADTRKAPVAALPETVERLPFSCLDALLNKGRALIESGEVRLSVELHENTPAVLLFAEQNALSPRIAMLSNQNLAFAATHVAAALGLTASDRFLSVLPLHHSYALIYDLLAPLSVGASVAFGEGFHAIVKNMSETHPTVLTASPMVAEALYRKVQRILSGYGKLSGPKISATNLLPPRLSAPLKKRLFDSLHHAFGGSLHTILCSGSPVGAHILKGLSDVGFAALECYGLCESAGAVTLNPRKTPRFGSVGKPLPDVMVDIYNRGEDGIGEIRIKSHGVMLGYFENQSATAETVRGGWLYTGDLGYIDEKGNLYVVGQKKNRLVTRTGKSIFPEELEALLGKEPFVSEAVVVGFVNQERKDYDLVAAIYPDTELLWEIYGENYTARAAENEIAAVIERVNATLPEHKRLDGFVLRECEFEKTSSRKIRRTGVAASVEAEYRKKLKK